MQLARSTNEMDFVLNSFAILFIAGLDDMNESKAFKIKLDDKQDFHGHGDYGTSFIGLFLHEGQSFTSKCAFVLKVLRRDFYIKTHKKSTDRAECVSFAVESTAAEQEDAVEATKSQRVSQGKKKEKSRRRSLSWTNKHNSTRGLLNKHGLEKAEAEGALPVDEGSLL
jgi:hypothetical protein